MPEFQGDMKENQNCQVAERIGVILGRRDTFIAGKGRDSERSFCVFFCLC